MDFSNYMRFIAALIFVLALIGIATWLARKFGFGARIQSPRRGRRRIEVVEVATVDGKHRAVLLRRDQTEHLVLMGATGDLLIESGIAAPPDRDEVDLSATPNVAGSGR